MTSIIRCNCGIFRAGEKDALTQWAAEFAFKTSDIDLVAVKNRLQTSLSLDNRCLEVGIRKFKVEIATRTFEATQGHKNGRVYAVDSQESWDIALPELLKGERDLIAK